MYHELLDRRKIVSCMALNETIVSLEAGLLAGTGVFVVSVEDGDGFYEHFTVTTDEDFAQDCYLDCLQEQTDELLACAEDECDEVLAEMFKGKRYE